MEVKKYNLCLVKMAMTAYLQICHLECLRCLLTRKEGAGFWGWTLGRDENKCSLCPKEWLLQEILHVVKHIPKPLPSIGMVGNTEETHSPEHKTKKSGDVSKSSLCSSVFFIVPLASEPTQVVPHPHTSIFTLASR